ncbi:MAG: gliding motility-associated protein GldE [Ferruginibacter sp.]
MDYHSVIFSTFLNINIITPATITILIVVILILLIISFLLSGSQVAFFSLTPRDLNLLKVKKQPSFRRIVNLMEQPKTLLAGMILANIFVNIAIIIIANILFESLLETTNISTTAQFFIKLGSIAFLIILFAEMLPKVWATNHKILFASTSSLLLEITNSLLYRLSKRIVKFTDRLEKRFSQDRSSSIDDMEIDYAIDLLPDHEATLEEKQILKGIRKFGGTSVKQIMRSRLDVSGIENNNSILEVLKIVRELNYSRIPIYKGSLDEIVGMLHTKDLLPHLNEDLNFDWETLIRKPYFVHEQKLIEDLLQEFRTKRMHFAIVVDEFGGTSGIVTLEDIMEEIIGEIEDEFDDEESVNKKIDDNNYIFEGKIMIQDACRAMKIPADTFNEVKGDSDSLAGLVLEIAGEFPQVDEELISGDFVFIPLEINKNRIDKIKITIKTQESNEN